jgi:hypothetical protein
MNEMYFSIISLLCFDILSTHGMADVEVDQGEDDNVNTIINTVLL